MKIQSPESYKGELGQSGSLQFKNQQKVWIVNGVIDKADANFLGSLYFDKIGDTQIYLGTYPLREDDIKKMNKAGITGVLNLQTKADIEQRGIPWDRLKQCYQENNIQCFRFPIKDAQEDELCASLFVAAQHLNNMINKKHLNVYVHCTSGISRGPAVALIYLCLFKRVKQWQNPQYVAQFVKAFHVNSNPNMRAVQRVVEANIEFQSQQIDHQSQKRLNSQSDELEGFSFPQMHGEKRDSISPRRQIGVKRSAYHSRAGSFVKPYEPKRPISPNPIKTENSPAPLLRQNKSQLVAKQTDQQMEEYQREVNPFNAAEPDTPKTTPEPQDLLQNDTKETIDAPVIIQDCEIETTQPNEDAIKTPVTIKRMSDTDCFKLQQTPRFDDICFHETLVIRQVDLINQSFSEDYLPAPKLEISNLRSVAVVTPRPNLREIQKQKKLQEETRLQEEAAIKLQEAEAKRLQEEAEALKAAKKQQELEAEAKRQLEEEAEAEFKRQQEEEAEDERLRIEAIRLQEELEERVAEEERQRIEARRIAFIEAKRVAEEEAIKEFQMEQAERRAKEEKILEAKKAQEEARRIALMEARRIAEEETIAERQKMSPVRRQQVSLNGSQTSPYRQQMSPERETMSPDRSREEDRLRYHQENIDSRAQRAQALREKRQIAEEQRKERERKAQEERDQKMKEEAEQRQKEEEEKRIIEEAKKQEEAKRTESPIRTKTQRTFRMTQTIQSCERQLIMTKEQVVFGGLKAIELKNVSNQEDEAKRKQDETLRRARWSYKAVEQAAQEAAKQAEAERLRKEEEERIRLEEERRRQEEEKRRQEEEQRRLEEEEAARKQKLWLEEEKKRKIEEERLRQIKEEQRKIEQAKREQEEEQKRIEEAKKRQEEEKRRIQQEIKEIEEQRRKIEEDKLKMEQEKKQRLVQEQQAREVEIRKREEQQLQQELELKKMLQKQRIDEQNRQREEIRQQEELRRIAELERKKIFEEEQRKREEEHQIRLKEIREIELRQRKNDEMEALSKFILFDMVKENVRDAVTESYFEMEFLEKERHQLMLEQAEIERERLKQEKLASQQAEILRRQEENKKRLEMERIRKVHEEMEREKQRLRLIAEENEIQRRKIAKEAEILRQQEEDVRRQARMRQMQLEQEEEAERLALEKIQKEKNNRLEILRQQEYEAEKVRQRQLAEERAERQRLLEIAEKETEKIRQLKIKTAQEELQRLQNLRKEEEQRLQEIKKSYEEEERNRQIQLQKQEEIEKQRQLKYREHEQAERVKLLKRDLQRKQEQEELKSRRIYAIESTSPTHKQSQIINNIPEEPSEIQPQSSCVADFLVEPDATYDSIEKHCDEIFREAPIVFKCRKGNKLEEQMQKLIKKLKITIPVIHVRQQSYLVGTTKVNLEAKFQSIMIRVGGGVERFDIYVPKNHRKMERQLVDYMSKSQESLQWVCDALIRGEKIKKKIELPFQAKMIQNKNQELIKKVTLNLEQRHTSNGSALSNRSGMRDESFLSRGSGYSSGRKINLSTQSGIMGLVGRTHVPISRGNLSPSRGLRPMFGGNGDVLYDGDQSPTRFRQYPAPTPEKFDHKKILEQMFAKKEMSQDDLRSMGSHHSGSPRRFGTISSARRNKGWIQNC